MCKHSSLNAKTEQEGAPPGHTNIAQASSKGPLAGSFYHVLGLK